MALLKFFLLATFLLVPSLVHADHNQTGFLSIDCGYTNSSYIDESMGFLYLSDTNFVETGESMEIAETYKVKLVNQRQFLTVRSFPREIKNCYTLRPTLGKGTKYMIRARFMYGNYDSLEQTPAFDLYLGEDFWDSVIVQVAWVPVDKEISFFHESDDDVNVCLVNTGFGVPFISALELRPWDNKTYGSETGSLKLFARIDLNPSTDQIMRYEDDDYDRLWEPLATDEWTKLNITNGENITNNIYQLPSQVMSTAYMPNKTTGNLDLTINALNSNSTSKYYMIFFHISELQLLPKNESREFNIFVNGDLAHGPFVPNYLSTITLVSKVNSDTDGKIRIWLNQTKNSTRPPLLNALEIYSLSQLSQQETNNTEDGFLSIDCGSSVSSYTDEATGFLYLSDKDYVETGVSSEIAEAYKTQLASERQFLTVRSFPQGTRNCYTFKPTLRSGTKYMVRARFLYGNYDYKVQPPTFDLYFGVDLWDTVILTSMLGVLDKEITFVQKSDDDIFHVCLVNTGFGVPFISVLELRPWSNKTYVSETGSLQLIARADLNPSLVQIMRYKGDAYDRVWIPFASNALIPLNTTKNITKNIYEIPSQIMRTAYMPNKNSGVIGLNVNPINSSRAFKYYFYFHFAELQLLPNNESREFNVFLNGNLSLGPFVPSYLATTTLVSSLSNIASDGVMHIQMNRTKNSTQPPLLNALEIYVLSQLSQQETDPIDVKAILKIKSVYGVKRNWQGDPCGPKPYIWDGLSCTYSNNHLPRISSLDLSSSGLEGEISPYIANLTMLQYLDLSNNSLSGKLPEFLAELSLLRDLKLKGNNLRGPVSPALLERVKNGLSLSVDDNVIGNESPQSPKKNETSSSVRLTFGKDRFADAVFASITGFLLAKEIKAVDNAVKYMVQFGCNRTDQMKSHCYKWFGSNQKNLLSCLISTEPL